MKDENTKTYVVDASYVLSFLMTDEGMPEVDDFFSLYADGVIQCISSSILPYEVLNALAMAVRRKRTTETQAREAAKKFFALHIPLIESDYMKCLSDSLEYSTTVYDASYLTLAHSERAPLKTHDNQLKKLLPK